MSSPFIGEIIMFGGSFAPRNWAFCNGQLTPVSQNNALFSLLGTIYGGDGRTTFGLPELRGRLPMHAGNGPSLSPRSLGQRSGSRTRTLTAQQIPAHKHDVKPKCDTNNGSTDEPTDNFVAGHQAENDFSVKSDGTMAAVETELTGGGQSFNVVQPYLAVNFIIALNGVYPSRN